MRNDARPIGTDAGHQSPVTSRQSPAERPDAERSPRDRRSASDIVNRSAEETVRRDERDTELTMPANDSLLNTKI